MSPIQSLPATTSYAPDKILTKVPNTKFPPIPQKVSSEDVDLKTQSTDVDGSISPICAPLNYGTLSNPLVMNQGFVLTNDSIEPIPINPVELVDGIPCVK